MKTSIEIFPLIKEKRLPLISLTKSKNGETGTATFTFIRPTAFRKTNFKNKNLSNSSYSNIGPVILIQGNEEKKFTQLIDISFKNGKPLYLTIIFIFLTKDEYFSFFQFLQLYCKENNLTYTKDFEA